jgi:hypothetical protein
LVQGEEHGEEDYESSTVDEGRCPLHAESARARKIKTTVIARKLKRSVRATYQQVVSLGVPLGVRRKEKKM